MLVILVLCNYPSHPVEHARTKMTTGQSASSIKGLSDSVYPNIDPNKTSFSHKEF